MYLHSRIINWGKRVDPRIVLESDRDFKNRNRIVKCLKIPTPNCLLVSYQDS